MGINQWFEPLIGIGPRLHWIERQVAWTCKGFVEELSRAVSGREISIDNPFLISIVVNRLSFIEEAICFKAHRNIAQLSEPSGCKIKGPGVMLVNSKTQVIDLCGWVFSELFGKFKGGCIIGGVPIVDG